jgi:hypothetical protein
MKKWTVQLGLLLGFAAITIIGSRIMVSKQKSSLAIQEYRVETKAIDKVQSAVLLQGLGKHLLDLLK